MLAESNAKHVNSLASASRELCVSRLVFHYIGQIMATFMRWCGNVSFCLAPSVNSLITALILPRRSAQTD